MAHDTGKLARHIATLQGRHRALDVEAERLFGLAHLMTGEEEARLRYLKVRKVWLRVRIAAAERLLASAPAVQVFHDPSALQVAIKVEAEGMLQAAA